MDTSEPEARTKDYQPTLDLVLQYFPLAKKKKLEIGDIQYKDVVIELKSFKDLWSALTVDRGERFRNQLYNMHLNPTIKFFYIVYGSWDSLAAEEHININAIMGAIGSINGRYRIPCIPMPAKKAAVYLASRIIEKSYDDKIIKPVTLKVKTEDRAVNMVLASGLRIIETGARNALKKFDTLKKMVNAPEKELKDIEKFGDESVKKFIQTINYSFNGPPLLEEIELEEKEEKEPDEEIK